MKTYNVFQVFCGGGGGGLGFKQAAADFRGIQARFETVGAIDVDPMVCEDYRIVTGGDHATPLDLFTAADYEAFHGTPPPDGWREATPTDLLAITGGRRPDVVFGSPPCKGFSDLLSETRSKGAKYQALNNLVVRWAWLVLEAWRDDPPGLFLLENVPRIQRRGRPLLDRLTAMLASYGYAVRETTHNCGELGALSQNRQRFLMVARRTDRVSAVLYEPRKHPVRPIRDVLATMPMPEDPAAGPMHVLPRIQALTWIRLALIRAGKDWRDLAVRWAPDRWGIVPAQGYNNKLRLVRMDEPSPVVTGGASPSAGGLSVADVRGAMGQHNGKLRVEDADQPSHTVTGSDRVGSGALSVADPLLGCAPRSGTMGVQDVDRPAAVVTGVADVHAGATAVADPRPAGGDWHKGVLGVLGMDQTSSTVTGRANPSTGPFAVGDPRLGCAPNGATLRVVPADQPSPTVTGTCDPWSSSALQFADREGAMHELAAAGATRPLTMDDLEAAAKAGPVVILVDGEDGQVEWHRPFTTLELAALQGFPVWLDEAKTQPLTLAGGSTSRWRMTIGNAVPPPAARAIAEQMLHTLLVSDANGFILTADGKVWVGGRVVAQVDLDRPREALALLEGLPFSPADDVGPEAAPTLRPGAHVGEVLE